MCKFWRFAWIAVLLGLLPGYAGAHSLGWSYVFLSVTESTLEGRLELDRLQLDKLYVADSDGDGTVSDAESSAYQRFVEAYAQERFEISIGGAEVPYRFVRHDLLTTKETSYQQVFFEASVTGTVPRYIDVSFTPFTELDDTHRGGLVLENSTFQGIVDNERVISAVYADGRSTATIDLHGDSWLKQVWNFVIEGIWHIWIGFDHVLFLVTLLLTAVLVHGPGGWQPVPTFRQALINLVTVVTLFTIAHSITLGLAMKAWVFLPARLVESVIALSVLLVALNILKPVVRKKIWIVVFVFGLFHGLGFASVLVDLVITTESKLASLIGFNVGVEIGQLAIVAVVFPILYWLRDKTFYLRFALPVVAVCIALLSSVWLVTRAFDITI